MSLGVSQIALQSYNIFLLYANPLNVLIINVLFVWHIFCYHVVLDGKQPYDSNASSFSLIFVISLPTS